MSHQELLLRLCKSLQTTCMPAAALFIHSVGCELTVQAGVQVPEPFQLPGDALHQHAEAAKQQYLEEEEQKRKAQAAFKVRTAPHCLLAQLHCWAA